MNSSTDFAGYSRGAIFLHWLVAILIVAQFIAGWTMDAHEEGMPAGPISNTHLSIGLTIGLLALIRIVSRIAKPVPQLPNIPAWQRRAAETMHIALLAMIIFMPISGLVHAAGEGSQFYIFGVIAMPNFIAHESGFAEFMEEAHETGATILLILIGLHVLAALYHHFVQRDEVLRRMLPYA